MLFFYKELANLKAQISTTKITETKNSKISFVVTSQSQLVSNNKYFTLI